LNTAPGQKRTAISKAAAKLRPVRRLLEAPQHPSPPAVLPPQADPIGALNCTPIATSQDRWWITPSGKT